MTPTPYLKKFNPEGGTLYVFPSVSRDLTRTLVSNDYEFKFSHFACLNLPDIYSGSYNDDSDSDLDDDKGLYIETLSPVSGWTDEGIQNAITENLQNYVMNFETAILNGEGDNDDYDNDILTSVSEKVFWNWMSKIGAIKFDETDTREEYGDIHKRTVQYIGNINILNAVEINGDTFDELYIHIPSTAGASTNVYFRTGDMTDNKNYLNKNYVVANGDNNPEYIIGRDGDEHPYGLSTTAIYDVDAGGNIYVGDVGHTIDFRDSTYDNGYGISNMNNKSIEDFEFNAILIYYDIIEKTSTPGVKRVSTNLYGILFLDQVTPSGGNQESSDQVLLQTVNQESKEIKGYFQRYPKKRETVYGNGNSYGLKIDLKIDTIGDNNWTYGIIAVPVPAVDGSSDVSYDPGDWQSERIVSMMHYTKALTELQKCIDFFFEQKNELVKLTQRIATLENLVLGIDSVDLLKEDIQRLYDLCDSNAIVDTSALLSLIDANTKKLENIMSGGKDLKLQFDTDVIQPGNGIGIKKSLNKVVISSEQKYSINTVYDGNNENTEINRNNCIDTKSDKLLCRIPLLPGENFAVVYLKDSGDCDKNVVINVDDSEYNWEVGQSLKIYFVCENGSLRFTDSINTGVVIKLKPTVTLSIPGLEVEGNNLIEVICVALTDSVDNGDVNDDNFIYLIK